MTTINLKISMDKIDSVYVGNLTGCLCGCAGYYVYTKEHVDNHVKNGGLSLHHDDDEIMKIIEEMNNQDDLIIGSWRDEIQIRTNADKGYVIFINTKD